MHKSQTFPPEQKSGPKGVADAETLEEAQERNVAPIPSLDDSDDNWFDDIVSKAITEAGEERVARAGEPNSATVDALHMQRVAEVPARAVEKEPAKPGSCSSRAQAVRQAVRSGVPATANKSAMRLDPRRFIRLSLASRKLDLSNQELMMAALDAYLDTLDQEVFAECACMKKGLI